MRSNMVRIHRLAVHRGEKQRWVTQPIELQVSSFDPPEEGGEPYESVQGFIACAMENHDECRTQHAISETEGYRVLPFRGQEIVRVVYDPTLGVLDIYTRARE